ncbi:unnamed protein product [Orchesella dallaii]|uniref:Lipase domain-containing protein n=1 Tax=Orchesella dallaii TaxID=48710 RepID=A0ABP1RBU7_9HEXA
MKRYKFLTFFIQVLLICAPCFKSELSQTKAEEVDNTDEKIPDTKPPNSPNRTQEICFQYAISPEDAEKMIQKYNITEEDDNDDMHGRSFFTEEVKKERQKQIRYLHKNQDNKWEALDINTMENSSSWNRAGKLKVLIHGLTSETHKNAEQLIKDQYMFQLGDAYMQERNDNVIIVDWTSLSRVPLYRYYIAADSTRYAGEAVAAFLIEVINRRLISSWKDVHIIGHSLGSHVSGVSGYEIHKQTESKVGRISGLDPAGPLFDDTGSLPSDTSRALDKSDADFVDIIHTNIGDVVTTLGGALGSTVVAGSVDFYLVACSHQASVRYFVESINNPVLACPCEYWKKYHDGNCNCTAQTGGTFMGDGCSERFY